MKIKITMGLFFIMCFNYSFAQYKVIDTESNVGVEFAAIYNSNLKEGTYSDIDGSFNLEINKNDTLIVSCVGYYSDTLFNFENLDGVIRMTPQVYNIDEIVYTVKSKSKKKEIGFRKERNRITFYSHIGSEWVVFIKNPNPDKNQIIESVILETKNHSKKEIGYRIHVYDNDSLKNLPGKELAKLDIIETSKHKGNKYNLNNSIIFPSTGVYIGIEWVSYLKENGKKINSKGDLKLSIPLTFNVENPLTYFRSKFFENKWYKAGSDHALSLVTGEENPPNVQASIIVKEFLNE